MHVHHRWAQSTALIQVSIALAAMALLTRNNRLKWLAYGSAVGSVVLGAMAWLQH